MTVIKCPKCGKENISGNTELCLGCGYNIKVFAIAEEQKKRELCLKKSRKSKLNNWKFMISISAIILIFIAVLYNPILKYINYQNAVIQMKNDEYDKAIEILKNINNVKSNDMIAECMYLKAIKKLENKKYDDAVEIFVQLGNYKDASELIRECQYQKAGEYFLSKDYKKAADIYLSLKDYTDSLVKAINSIYHLAELKYENQNYYEAIKILDENADLLNEYEEAVTLKKLILEQKEWFIDKAEEEYDQGNFRISMECYEYAKITVYNQDILGVNHYEDCKFMLSIQGEYISPVGKGTASIGGYTYTQNSIEYKIIPVKKQYEYEGTKIVGILNDNVEHYITFVEEGEIWCIKSNNEAWDVWETKERQILEEERINKIKENEKKEPIIGMTREEVENSTWGKPNDINKTTYEWGTTEQWCYPDFKYIYFTDEIVSAISE